jgi:hypothetical protein
MLLRELCARYSSSFCSYFEARASSVETELMSSETQRCASSTSADAATGGGAGLRGGTGGLRALLRINPPKIQLACFRAPAVRRGLSDAWSSPTLLRYLIPYPPRLRPPAPPFDVIDGPFRS